MKKIFLFIFVIVFYGMVNARNIDSVKITFDDVETGKLPSGWIAEETNAVGESSIWEVTEDVTAPSGKKVLALTDTKNNHGSTFNLCWTNKINFLNGEIKVMFKANSGKEDEGGGIMWRVKDKGNYYVVRFNPLEDNFRLYRVKNEYRKMIANADVKLSKRKWHQIKIVQKGKKISCYLNEKKLIETEDETFTNAGGVGVWTKADAATSFDNFEVNK